jgi:hypothetical protein
MDGMACPRAVNAWWILIIDRRNSPIIAPETMAIMRTLRGKHILLIVATSEPRHSFAVASKNAELSTHTFSRTANDLCVMQCTSDSGAEYVGDEHTTLWTRRRNGTKVQSAVKSRTRMRTIGRKLITKARLGQAMSTATFASTDDPRSEGSKNTAYIPGKRYRFLII